MKVLWSALLSVAIICETWRVCNSTCVLESDFGLIINCAFKKSTLFRIRNLGGVKAHISWGVSIGDELGFKESISNVEVNRRRAAPGSKLEAQIALAQQDAQKKQALNLTTLASDNTTSTLPTPAEKLTPPPVANEIGAKLKSSSELSSPPWTFSEDYNQIKKSPSSTILPALKVSKSDTTNKNASENFTTSTEIQLSEASSNPFSALPVTEVSNTLQGNKNLNETSSSKSPRKRRPSRKSNSSKRKSNVNDILIAPKEYHPAGYAKTFDESFVSKMRLPKTDFQCKNQIYFPGLYADDDLGCMVFHVCVALDNGAIVSKSFLCPESTLFDQSMLRCNWWFYVDCKQSKDRYSTNIPVVRSYQIMRALSAITENRQPLQTTTAKPKEKD